MFPWGKARSLACGLALVLAGCSTRGHLNHDHIPDWEAEGLTATAPQPQPAPPLQPMPPSKAGLPAAPATNTTAPSLAPPGIESRETWVGLVRWCKNHNLPPPRLLNTGPPAAYVLSGAKGALSFRAGSLVATWEGVELRLGFPPRSIDGQPFCHALDVQKTLLPLLDDNFALPGSNRVIVLDPGHGGENAGTRSVLGHSYEKDFTLDWARRLVPLLSSNGWTVFLTRTNDTDLALSNRVAVADFHHADLFVSLHFNSSAPDENQHGLETYCLTPVGMPSTVTRDFSDEIGVTFANNAFDVQNLEFALRLHRALLQVRAKRDRGIRRARFPGVLRGQQRPAVLIEGGYLSNPGEAQLIATPGYRQKLAEALALAFGSRLENKVTVPVPPAPTVSQPPKPDRQNGLFDEP